MNKALCWALLSSFQWTYLLHSFGLHSSFATEQYNYYASLPKQVAFYSTRNFKGHNIYFQSLGREACSIWELLVHREIHLSGAKEAKPNGQPVSHDQNLFTFELQPKNHLRLFFLLSITNKYHMLFPKVVAFPKHSELWPYSLETFFCLGFSQYLTIYLVWNSQKREEKLHTEMHIFCYEFSIWKHKLVTFLA